MKLLYGSLQQGMKISLSEITSKVLSKKLGNQMIAHWAYNPTYAQKLRVRHSGETYILFDKISCPLSQFRCIRKKKEDKPWRVPSTFFCVGFINFTWACLLFVCCV